MSVVSYKDACWQFNKFLSRVDVVQLCSIQASHVIYDDVDLGELPDGIYRTSATGYFRLASIAGPVLEALREIELPALADLPDKPPSDDALLHAALRWRGAAARFGAEVALAAPRRAGASWQVADLSGGFPPSALPMLEVARERLVDYAGLFLASAMAEEVA